MKKFKIWRKRTLIHANRNLKKYKKTPHIESLNYAVVKSWFNRGLPLGVAFYRAKEAHEIQLCRFKLECCKFCHVFLLKTARNWRDLNV